MIKFRTWLNIRIFSLEKRIELNNHAIEMYGLDIWGHDAFSNIQKMEKFQKENKKLNKKKDFFEKIEKFFYARGERG